MVKASVCNAGDLGSVPGSKSHGWRNLVGYSPWGHKESLTHFLYALALCY